MQYPNDARCVRHDEEEGSGRVQRLLEELLTVISKVEFRLDVIPHKALYYGSLGVADCRARRNVLQILCELAQLQQCLK